MTSAGGDSGEDRSVGSGLRTDRATAKESAKGPLHYPAPTSSPDWVSGNTRLDTRLSTLLYVNCAFMRERFEPEDAVIAAHPALIDAAERQLVL